MNIVFILGNGFDINLGMKTQYKDFYKYYMNIKTDDLIISQLKEAISKDIENWSDLELKFGEYTKNINSEEEFNVIFQDMEDKLADYLAEQEENFNKNAVSKDEFYKYLISPDEVLPVTDRDNLFRYRNQWNNEQKNIYVITFNYTKTLESILDYKNESIYLDHKNILHRIKHIHGYINENMVLGVNDTSQVSNEKFHKNINVLENIVKSECNKAQKHNIDDECKEIITKAELIYLFGSSIGDTDKLWWELIGEQIKFKDRLVIFEKVNDSNISPRRPQYKSRLEREKINSFLDKTNLSEEEKKGARGNITVGINTDLFKIKNTNN